MVRRILVAYDGSDLSKKAIQEAKVQAGVVENTVLEIITVVTPGITTNNTAIAGNLSMNDAESIFPELEEIKEDLKREGYNVKVEIITDFSQKNPGHAICDYADENVADMIIVGHRGLSNLKKLFLGSVSSTILQQAHCQVLVIK